MEMLWWGIGFLAGGGAVCFWLGRQLARRLRSVVSGTAVEGRVVRRYSSEGPSGDTHWHHVHGFTTLDGRYVEFEEDAVLLAPGDPVTVRYRPHDPERTATIMGSGGTWSPLFGALLGVGVSGMFALAGVYTIWLYVDR